MWLRGLGNVCNVCNVCHTLLFRRAPLTWLVDRRLDVQRGEEDNEPPGQAADGEPDAAEVPRARAGGEDVADYPPEDDEREGGAGENVETRSYLSTGEPPVGVRVRVRV